MSPIEARPYLRPLDWSALNIVLLGGDVQQVWQALSIARQTVHVATQGILLGIGLSILAMLVEWAGFLPPLAGAILQEGIDVLVIVNALRATRFSVVTRPLCHAGAVASSAGVPSAERTLGRTRTSGALPRSST